MLHVWPLVHTPFKKQAGSWGSHRGTVVVVVVVGQVDDVGTVVAPQQKPTASGWSCTSFRLHDSRIFTEELNVPSWRGLAHRTALLEVVAIASTMPAAVSKRAMPPHGADTRG